MLKLIRRISKTLFLFVLTFLLSMITNTKVEAQRAYSYQLSNAVYTPLSNATRIQFQQEFPGDFVDRDYPITGKLMAFADTFDIKSIVMYRGGVVRITDRVQGDLACFYYIFMADLEETDSSSMWVDNDSRTGNIIKLEWRNMTFKDRPRNEFVNFQLWLDKLTGNVSYHYGKSNYTKDSIVGSIGISRALSPEEFTHSRFLHGDYSNPSLLQTTQWLNINNVTYGKNFLSEGTVITFKPAATGLLNIGSNKQMAVYPNPAKDKIYVDVAFFGKEVEVFNMQGQRVIHHFVNTDGSILLDGLHEGFYQIKVGNYLAKISINHEL